jgi:hypothetical protein
MVCVRVCHYKLGIFLSWVKLDPTECGPILRGLIYYDWNDVMYDARGMFCAVVGDNVLVTDTDTCLEDTEYPNQKP